jgi:hypothetical protein
MTFDDREGRPLYDLPRTIEYQNNDPVKHKHDKSNLDNTNVPYDDVKIWTEKGRHRYDTILVRNIEWFVQCHRVMRMFMRQQLDWVSDPIAHKSDAISKKITEYDSNEKFSLTDFD